MNKFLCIFFLFTGHLAAKALFIVGPSGVGKSTCIHRIVQESNGRVKNGVSHTTRAKRQNEKNGKDYYFITQAEFDLMKGNNEFIITSEEFNESYGLAYKEIGEDEIFIKDVGVQSIEILKEKLGNQCFFVFLAPPSYEVLKERLQGRGLESKESQASLERRLENAAKIMAYEPLCDLTIVATEVSETVAKFQAVIAAMESGGDINRPISE